MEKSLSIKRPIYNQTDNQIVSNIDKPKVSVILPVYNVKPWIGDCIESFKRQTLKELEFIFVDDCSMDGSLSVIEAFAEEDPRVRIICNETNSGSGPSRNRGIDEAKGEYLSFIDPDDWISDNFYEVLYSKAKSSGSDIAKGVRVIVDEEKQISKNSLGANYLNEKINVREKRGLPLYVLFTYEHQSAIYKAELFKNKKIRYGETKVAQDTTFLLRICSITESIVLTEEAEYYYRERSGAATAHYTLKRALGVLDSLDEKLDFVLQHKSDLTFGEEYIIKQMKTYLTNYYFATLEEDISDEDKETYRNRFMKIVERSGFEPRILREIPELEVFKKYGCSIPVSLPRRKNRVFQIKLDGLRNLFEDHPELNNKKYIYIYSRVIAKMVYWKIEGKLDGNSAGRASWEEIGSLLKPLSIGNKIRVFLYMLIVAIKTIVKRATRRI